MKKTFLTTAVLVTGLFVASVLIASCGNKKEQSTEEHGQAQSDTTSDHHDEMNMDSTEMNHMDSTQMAYACPMHPEAMGKEGDKCSKCGMKLEPVKEHKDDHNH